MERLQKILARAGIGSRRHCEKLIEQGKVKVNEKTTQLGDKATIKDKITVNGKLLKFEETVYIILNKPPGYISSTVKMEHGQKTIMSLVRIKQRVYPVGRLDKNSQGLMILTNDGELANKLTHPSFNVEKEYLVWTAQPFNHRHINPLRNIVIDGKKVGLKKATIETNNRIRLVLHEGRKHIIRKALRELKYKILRLKRVRIGTLELSNVAQGTWRFLSRKELRSLSESLKVADNHTRPA